MKKSVKLAKIYNELLKVYGENIKRVISAETVLFYMSAKMFIGVSGLFVNTEI